MAKPTPTELLNDAVSAMPKPRRSVKRGERVGSWYVGLPLEVADAIKDAAYGRGMTMSAYLRRAATAFAAYDTGVDFYELSENEYAISEPGQTLPGVRKAGRGHGSWVIRELQQ
jgi:hypothetical protein